LAFLRRSENGWAVGTIQAAEVVEETEVSVGKNISVDTSQFEAVLRAYAEGFEGEVSAAVVTSGKPEDYWRSVERGSARGRRPWPNPRKKTTLGAGGRVFSKQAPTGFVGRFQKQFQQFLVDAYREVVGNGVPTRAKLVLAVNRATEKARSLIRGAAPVDSGALKNSIEVKPAE